MISHLVAYKDKLNLECQVQVSQSELDVLWRRHVCLGYQHATKLSVTFSIAYLAEERLPSRDKEVIACLLLLSLGKLVRQRLEL